jgi:hypothetical protein
MDRSKSDCGQSRQHFDVVSKYSKGSSVYLLLQIKFWIQESYWFESLKHQFCCRTLINFVLHCWVGQVYRAVLNFSVLLGLRVKCHTYLFHALSRGYLSPWSHWTLQTYRLRLPWFSLSHVKVASVWNIIFCSLVGRASSSNRKWRQ